MIRTIRGLLWLNPIVMFVDNCNRAEGVECFDIKPCWSGAGKIYLLMVGRIRFSMNFAAGQRRMWADMKISGRCLCQASV